MAASALEYKPNFAGGNSYIIPEITMIGLDLAKHVFQVHGVDAAGGVIVRKALRRAQVMPFFAKLSPCWSVSRRAELRITGHAS